MERLGINEIAAIMDDVFKVYVQPRTVKIYAKQEIIPASIGRGQGQGRQSEYPYPTTVPELYASCWLIRMARIYPYLVRDARLYALLLDGNPRCGVKPEPNVNAIAKIWIKKRKKAMQKIKDLNAPSR